MKRIDRYLVREMIVPFLIGTVAIVLMFQANLLIAQGKELRLEALPASAVFQLVLFRTPEYLVMTLPAGMALASALAISRLARESELTAMRSAGVSIFRVVTPIAVVGVLVSILNFLIVEEVMPVSTRRANKLYSEMVTKALGPTFQSNVILRLSQYLVSIGTVQRTPTGIALSDIMLIERPHSGETWITRASEGNYKDGVWTLEAPIVTALRGPSVVTASSNERLVINEPIRIEDFFRQPLPNEQTLSQLRQAINEGQRMGRDTRNLEIVYHVRYSLPATCLVFAFTGPVLAVLLARSGPFMGVLLSIFLVLLYYNVFVISTEVIGRNGWLNPMLAAWMPNIIFLGLGLFALRRAE